MTGNENGIGIGIGKEIETASVNVNVNESVIWTEIDAETEVQRGKPAFVIDADPRIETGIIAIGIAAENENENVTVTGNVKGNVKGNGTEIVLTTNAVEATILVPALALAREKESVIDPEIEYVTGPAKDLGIVSVNEIVTGEIGTVNVL